MSSVVKAEIYSNLSEYPVERRFDPNIEVSKLKEKLEPITGANHKTMIVSLSINDKLIGTLDQANKSLADYIGQESIRDQIKLEVKDDEARDLLTGDVEKYTIPEEKYVQRPDNVRNFIKDLRQKKNDANSN